MTVNGGGTGPWIIEILLIHLCFFSLYTYLEKSSFYRNIRENLREVTITRTFFLIWEGKPQCWFKEGLWILLSVHLFGWWTPFTLKGDFVVNSNSMSSTQTAKTLLRYHYVYVFFTTRWIEPLICKREVYWKILL